MNVQRGKIVSGGRLQLPVDVRRALSLSDGDIMQIEVVDGEIRLRPQRDAIRRIKERMRPFITEGHSVVDELIAERREAARNE